MIENNRFLNTQSRFSFCVPESTYKKAFFPFLQYAYSAILDVEVSSKTHPRDLFLLQQCF